MKNCKVEWAHMKRGWGVGGEEAGGEGGGGKIGVGREGKGG